MHALASTRRIGQTALAGLTFSAPHLSAAAQEGASAAGSELGLLGYLGAALLGVFTGLGGWLFGRNRSIRARLFTLTAVFGILLGGLATLIYREGQAISELLDDVAQSKTPALVALANAEGSLFDLTLAAERGAAFSEPVAKTRAYLDDATRLLVTGAHPDPKARDILVKLRAELDGFVVDLQSLAATRQADAGADRFARAKADLLARQTALRAGFVASCEEVKGRVTEEVRAARTLARESEYLVIGMSGLALVVGLAISLVFSANITRVLRNIAVELADGSRQTAAAAGQVSGSGQQLASGTSQQAASLEETSASLEELNATARTNTSSLSTVADLATRTRKDADRASAGSRELAQAMDGLAEASREIGKIVKTIDEIAFQTNILALNAAVEAARAGEAGAGFSVVADEVRALAQRSAGAARETATRITGAIERTQAGIEIGRRVDTDVSTVTGRITEIDQLVGQVLAALREESTGLGQIATAVQQLDQVTQGNAAAAEEMAAAAEEMSAQAAVQAEAVRNLQTLITGADSSAGSAILSPRLPQPGPAAAPRTADPPPGLAALREKPASLFAG